MKVLGISPEEAGKEFIGLGGGSKKPAAATCKNRRKTQDISDKNLGASVATNALTTGGSCLP